MTPSQQAPLVERLNDPIAHDRETTVQLICRWRTERREAAARITELEHDTSLAYVAELRERAERAEAQCRVLLEALKPFAEACAHLHPSQPDDGVTLDGFEVRDFRRAARAFAPLPTTSEGGGA